MIKDIFRFIYMTIHYYYLKIRFSFYKSYLSRKFYPQMAKGKALNMHGELYNLGRLKKSRKFLFWMLDESDKDYRKRIFDLIQGPGRSN